MASRVLMEKRWYIKLDSEEEGPYTIFQLKNNPYITPDTLVRAEGEENWFPVGQVEELEEIFEDNEKQGETTDVKRTDGSFDGELTLDYRMEPYYFYLWLLLLIAVLIYVFMSL